MSDEMQDPAAPTDESLTVADAVDDTDDAYVDPEPGELVDPKRGRQTMPGATSPVRIAQLERQRRALHLRSLGTGYHDIAQQLGYASAQSAQQSVSRALRRVAVDDAKAVKAIRVEQTNQLMLRLAPDVIDGDVAAINTTLRIMQYQDELLGVESGRTAGISNTLVIIEGDEQQYIENLRKMMGEVPVEEEDDADQEEDEEDPIIEATARDQADPRGDD